MFTSQASKQASARKRILVAEDNEEQRLLLKAYMRDVDADFEFVGDGAQALDAYQRARAEHRPYTLLVLDVVMPEMSGLRAAEIIRSEFNDKTTPIRFLTAEQNVTGITQTRATLADGEIWLKQHVGDQQKQTIENALEFSKLDPETFKQHIVDELRAEQ